MENIKKLDNDILEKLNANTFFDSEQFSHQKNQIKELNFEKNNADINNNIMDKLKSCADEFEKCKSIIGREKYDMEAPRKICV